jgi:hypothetical protein
MMQKLCGAFLIGALCFFSTPLAAQQAGTSDRSAAGKTKTTAEKAMDTIQPAAIRAHMRFLSNSLLEGRAPDSPGYQIAARYVAAELEGMGVHPAGANGTWFQQVPLRKSVVAPAQSSLTLRNGGKEKKLVEGDDYVLVADLLRQESGVEAPLVFVGFGVTATEQGYDDYKGIDVRGKIVVTLRGAPPRFETSVRAFYSDGVIKQKNAVAHGAAGVLRILPPEDWKRYPWSWYAPQIQAGDMEWLDQKGEPENTFPELKAGALLSEKTAELLFDGASKTAEQVYTAARASQPQSFPLKWTARIHTVSRHTNFSSPNIVGKIEGSDAALRSQYVVYSAHLDHLGICPAVNGDNVCHGAVDNASGTAAVLEIARAFTRLPRAPRRSLLFVLVTGEEEGLLGSDYFAHSPTIPPESLVANVNVDGAPGLFYAMKDVVAAGSEHSSLDRDVRAAARQVGYTVVPDPLPEEVFFIRSDQYSFVQRGVPSLFVMDGPDASAAGVNGLEVQEKWFMTRYHTPLDDMDQPLDYESGAKGVRFEFLVGFEIAQQEDRPAWNPHDFFGEKFAPKK